MTTLQSLSAPEALSSHVTSTLADAQPSRFDPLVERLRTRLDVAADRSVFLASAPGRTELAGNHTDHNNGKVLAGSVDLDTIAAVAPRDDLLVRIASEGFPRIELDLDDLQAHKSERETAVSLVRGVAAAFVAAGRTVGGFDAAVSSRVMAGSGLSSSASFEVLVGTILDHGWNGDGFGPTEIAKAGRYAENVHFGKPSGLMDQVACATGGVVTIDFRDTAKPEINRLDVDFADAGLALLVVDTGGGHADLTHEYAAIPADMRAVAKFMGAEVLAQVDPDNVLARLGEIRTALGDRAAARALHFYAENARVEQMVTALRAGDFTGYLRLMSESGRSSGMFLQNCAPASAPDEQAVVIALALTERFFATSGLRSGNDAACRVHGGGFAGTIQVLLPADRVPAYAHFLAPVLGPGAVTELRLRNLGAVAW